MQNSDYFTKKLCNTYIFNFLLYYTITPKFLDLITFQLIDTDIFDMIFPMIFKDISHL